MYDIEEIIKGIRNPHLVSRHLRRHFYRQIHGVINTAHILTESSESRYGIVLNKGMYWTGKWSVASNRFFVDRFIEEYDPVVISSQRVYEKYKDQIDHLFSLIPGYSAPKIEYTGDHETICIFTADPDGLSGWFQEYADGNGVDFVLTTYYEPFRHFLPEFDEDRLVHFPWSVPDQFVVDPEDVRYTGDDVISIFGAANLERYNVRDWCREFPFVENFDIAHYNKDFDDDEFYRWLRQFDAMIAAGSEIRKWSWMYAKYVEIPAAGSLLFAHECADLERAGFDRSNCVPFTRDDFEQKAREYLEDPERYVDTRRSSVELVLDQHTISSRIDTIDHLFHTKYT